MTVELRIISSMATRALLADLAAEWHARADAPRLAIESVGGVDAARRVRAGEAFDGVVLASDAIASLLGQAHLRAGSAVDLVRSDVVAAVRTGAPAPELSSEDALRRAVQAAPSIGYSTGPSGTRLLELFERWGLAAEIAPRLRQAPPGVPVGGLVAAGDVVLGFQQRSELMGLAGVRIVGSLPEPVRIVTVFTGAVAAASRQPEATAVVLSWMAGAGTDELKRRHGMENAR